jgi:hypothetical protein
MVERYPIGETEAASVEVRRHQRADTGYGGFSLCILLHEGQTLLRLPGHYGGVLAERLRAADTLLAEDIGAESRRVYRDEFLELTALDEDDEPRLALTTTARAPVRVALKLEREELQPLAALLEDAQSLVDTLRKGISLVPDFPPDRFADPA